MKHFEGILDVFGTRVGVVAAKFNPSLAVPLFENVILELKNAGVDDKNITTVQVPGALEVPGTILRLLKNHELDLVIALGIVVEGETIHFDHVSEQAVRGIVDITMTYEIPIVNGILAGTADQMKDRVLGGRAKAPGFVKSGLEMVDLYKKL